MNRDYLKRVIVDQRELAADKLASEKLVLRDGLSLCEKYLDEPNILLISGLRRAGKSFFAQMTAGGKKAPHINFDDERLIDFKAGDFDTLLECFYELYPDFTHILLDEVQNIRGWELFASRLRAKYRLIITGSNANLLSSELATHLTGRYVVHTIFPLSFGEFLKFNGFDPGSKSAYPTRIRSGISALLEKYLKGGGIFEYYKFGAEFLRTLFSAIITKDIIARYAVKYPHLLEELAVLLVNYFASKISVNKLTRHLKIKSPHTTKEYIKYLENTFLIFTVNKFSFKLKEQLASFKKVYVVDNGLINSLTVSFSEDRGRFLENMVAVELKRKSLPNGFEFFYWDNYNVECDFIIKKGRKIVSAIQVCSELKLENRDREVNGLIAALGDFKLKEGIILTESMEDEFLVDGYKINVVPVWKWAI